MINMWFARLHQIVTDSANADKYWDGGSVVPDTNFPGSSGGLVISKPTNIAMIDQQLKYSKKKQFVFLGIYSGEYTWKEEVNVGGKTIKLNRSYGLGNVWYSSLIPEIINKNE